MPKVTVDNGPSNRWEDDTAQPPAGDATPAAAATADPGAGDGDGNGSEAVSEPQKTVKPKTRKPASGDGDGDGPEAA